jgi:hypothetical protein
MGTNEQVLKASRRESAHQTFPNRWGDGLRAIACFELAHRPLEVLLDRLRSDLQMAAASALL